VGSSSNETDGTDRVGPLAEAAKESLPMNARERNQAAKGKRQKRRGSLPCFFWLLLFPFSFCLVPSIALWAEETTSDTTVESEVTSAPSRRFSPDGQPLVNLVFAPGTNPNIDLITAQIKAATGITVTPMGAAKGQVIAAPLLKDTTVENALKWICAQKDWTWWKEGPNYNVADRAYFEKNVLSKNVVQRVIVPQNIPAADAAKAVERMKSPVGDIQFDARTNQVIVTDLLPVVEAIERTIKLLDQKVFLRVFTLKHADPKQVLDFLQAYKSPPGRLELVPKMRQIIAEDTYENIQRMEVMVDLLDRGPEMRIYDLNNIDFEGKALTDIQEYLDKEIITEGAYLKFDAQNGVMILIDLPSVHEKVQKILEAVDKPARQVYIQAEIVETNFDHTFKIGTDFTFADDLLVQAPVSSGGGTATVTPPSTSGVGTPAGTAATVSSTGASQTSSGNVFTDIAGMTHTLTPDRPAVNLGASGIALDYLSRHARIKFTAVMTDNETRVLAQPRVLVKNRQPAHIMDGGSLSYATTTYYGGGGYGYGQGTTGYNPYVPSVGSGSIPIGIDLMVDASIMNNGLIEMHVTLSNRSGQRKPTKLGGQEYDLVDTTDQNLDTFLVIPDGQTRMIGGMIRNNESDSVSGIPFLKDIPIIGPIVFGNKSTPISRRTLLMFITPKVVQEKARKYVVPPSEDEKTPPTFYEQASWNAAAVKRAVEEAVKETEGKYPGFKFPGRETGEAKKTTGVPVPTVRLEHEVTTESAETTKPAELRLPVEEERVTTLPQQIIPPSVDTTPPPKLEPTTATLVPKMPPPPTSPTLLPKLPAPSPRPTPEKKAQPTTTGTLGTRNLSAPTSPTLAPKIPAPTPRPTPKAFPTTRTLETRRPTAPTSPTVTPKAPKPSVPRDQPTTVTFPTTGTVKLQSGPPAVLLSARRPSDLPLPKPTQTAKARAPGIGPSLEEETGLGASSYELTVLGEGGRAATALPTGELHASPALGTIQIPLETLALSATPPPPAAPGLPPGTIMGPGGVIMPAMRTPPIIQTPPAVTPLRVAPTKPPTYPSTYAATPYGARPGITPPPRYTPGGFPGVYPPGSYPPGTYPPGTYPPGGFPRSPRTR
jgi:type II secretory pathway component GspD/PulD (secretin)